MPWEARGTVSLREEFVRLASNQLCNFSQLCGRFHVSRKTGYKWLKRFAAGGVAGLADRSRRPHLSPERTRDEIEKAAVALRITHPAWGARKLRHVLIARGIRSVPAVSTINDVLHRHHLIKPEQAAAHRAFQRFEREQPNEVWQMDYKGYFKTDSGSCHPLTVLDDHSRYALGVSACADERSATVRERLTAIFRCYGLPLAILCDNGPPWGTAGAEERHTELTIWLMQLGVRILHGRPYHPQTQGKDERFHRTLKAEVLWQRFADLAQCQKRFDAWREEYNWVRPHQALGLQVPGKRYTPSPRSYPEKLPEIEPSGQARSVDRNGSISVWSRRWKIGQAFRGQLVTLEPTQTDGVWSVRFHGQEIKQLNRRSVQ
jgi:transposase InsO family protein